MAIKRIKAIDSFSHGRLMARLGETYAINAVDAEDLAKAGLVEIVSDAAEDDIDDLVGSKMEPVTSNKMEGKPDNKAAKK